MENPGKSADSLWILSTPEPVVDQKWLKLEIRLRKKVFDFIRIAKIDLSNWYCIHAYFIEIQMGEKYGFFDFSIFSWCFRYFLVELHEFEGGKYSKIALFYDADLTKTYPKA